MANVLRKVSRHLLSLRSVILADSAVPALEPSGSQLMEACERSIHLEEKREGPVSELSGEH